MPRPDEMSKVEAICEGKEQCIFTPAGSFFGKINCKPNVNPSAWIWLDCINGQYSEQHVKGHKEKHVAIIFG